jgi:plastocyanin
MDGTGHRERVTKRAPRRDHQAIGVGAMRMSYVLLAVVAIGCGGGGGGDGYTTGPGTGTGPGAGAAAGTASISMQQSDDGYGTAVFSFSPGSVTIAKGGTVTWTNEAGKVAHNVTFAATTGAPANIPNMTSGSNSRSFAASGSYSYQCTNHPGMNGTVSVQ